MQSIHEVPLAMPLKSAERNLDDDTELIRIDFIDSIASELFTHAKPCHSPPAALGYITDSTEKSVAAPPLPLLAVPYS